MVDYKAVLQAIGSQRFGWRNIMIHGPALPAAALTYAQAGEDMALYKRLKYHVPGESKGFYVDIGCGAPHQLSNTYLFHSFGWRGICIDANADHAAAWAKQRPEDTFICAAIGERAGTVTLYRGAESNWGVASIGTPPAGKYQTGIEVPMRRLDDILAEHAPDTPISFMSIDVERSEDGVLASNDWTRWKPFVVLIECAGFDFDAPDAIPAVRFLKNLGYHLRDKIGENLLFSLE